MDNLISDVRYAIRTLVRNPAFTVVATLSLALGIGVNVVIFSVVNAVLEKPVSGVREPDRLVRLYRGEHSPLAYEDFRYFRERSGSFEGVVAERTQSVTMDRSGETIAVQAAIVPDDYFALLGVSPTEGALFSAAQSGNPVTVLGHDYWRSAFNGDPRVVGETVRINGSPFTIVGVASPAFTSSVALWHPHVFVPVSAARPVLGADPTRWNGSVYTIGRLRAGVDRAAAEAELRVLTSQLIAERPREHAGMTVRLDAARGVVAELHTPAAVVSAFLMAVVALVLLIACANVANLLLARSASRRREIGVRLAIGAGRGRIVRQLLTESLVLAVAGGVVAVLASVPVTRALAGVLATSLPVDLAVSFAPDTRVLSFAMLVSLVTAALFGLAPALQSVRRDLVTALRDDADRSGFRRSGLRSGLVVGQVALCTVLVAGSMLFLRSLGNARAIDPGFETAGIIDVPIDLSPRALAGVAEVTFYQRLLDDARAIAGVASATLASTVPLSGSNNQTTVWVDGVQPVDGQRLPQAYFNTVATDYLVTLRIPLVRGRDIGAADTREAAPVAVVNETMARRLWPTRDALGARFSTTGPTGPWITVVGVARDTRYNSLGETTPPFMYLPATQNHQSAMVLQLRVNGATTPVADAIRRVIAELDPQLPAARPVPLENDMQIALLPARIGAALLGAFGSLALLLASVGIYGVASFAVSRRKREMGIRAALGARRADVQRLVVGESMRRVGIGLVLGLLGAFGLARALASQLYGLAMVDPVTFVATPIILGGVALFASWVPARRASRVDPMVALRDD